MNKSLLNSNFEIFLTTTGSTWLLESIYLYAVTPFGITGILFNIINIITFLNFKSEKINLFQYMKVFTFNSILLSCMIFLFVFTHLPRYFDFSVSYIARFYRCIIMINVANMLNFYETVINILIILERMSSFVLKFKNLKNLPPYKASFLLFTSCIVISLPTFFMSYVKTQKEFIDDINNYNETNNDIIFRYCEKTAFSQSLIGKIMIALVIIIMNVITLIVEITVTIMTIYYFRDYLKTRAKIINKNQGKSLIDTTNTENKSILITTLENTSNNNSNNNQKNIKMKKMNKSNRNLTKMCIEFSIISSISNICILFYNLFVLFVGDNNYFYYYIVFAACLFTLLKLSSNFFFFYHYNSNFKTTFNNLINIII